jgi:hypothetical protein
MTARLFAADLRSRGEACSVSWVAAAEGQRTPIDCKKSASGKCQEIGLFAVPVGEFDFAKVNSVEIPGFAK